MLSDNGVIGKAGYGLMQLSLMKDEVVPGSMRSVVANSRHSTITKGVTLVKGDCVAAGAAVGKSFPDGAIIGGVPAKLIRQVDL